MIRTVKYLMNHREVEYDSDEDQDFDDDPFVESQSDVEFQSDVEETVTVVKKTTTCEICGVAFKGIKIHLAACKKKAEIKRLALLALYLNKQKILRNNTCNIQTNKQTKIQTN